MIKNFEPRLYQQTIMASCVSKNCLVVLPTGMGKTNIFLMLAAQRLKQYPNSKILLIGPTRPLIDQYFSVFKEHFDINEDEMAIFTGMVAPQKRAELWKKSRIFFSTSQGLENDIISGRINLEEVSLLGVDEAHRAVGDYAYVFVAKQYQKKARFPRIIGLTASPGSDMEKIKEVCNNLFIEEIEVRTEKDPDVKPYIKEIKVDWVKVNLPPIFSEVQKFLQDFLKERIKKLKEWGILHTTDLRFVNKKELLSLQAELRGRAASGEKDFVIWNAISVLAEVMKIYHGLELLETQGISALHAYFQKLVEEGRNRQSKAIVNIMSDFNFKSALIKSEKLFEDGIQHPKLVELQHIIEKEIKKSKDVKIIVFNQYRDNAVEIVNALNKIPGISAKIFVGQMKKGETGLSQKEQKVVLDDFREDKFNILVATSVGEEGLDVPSVDLVIFYEPIPSAIRHIQRRGRTGRQEKGRVIILMANETRDEGYRWSAHHKEKQMYKHLDNIKSKIKLEHRKDVSMNTFVPEGQKLKIFADHREKGSGVIKELADMGANVILSQLECADFILSSRVGIEMKTVEDFVDSIIDGRLLQQIKGLKENFERPLIIIEGTNDIYSMRNVHPNAIRGMLATITVSYGIPIINSRNFKESASLIYLIAKREQEETGKDFTLHGEKRVMTLKDNQEYIISSLPGVGAGLAKPLLRKFKSVKNIINASQDELKEVEKIGEKKAKAIKDAVESEYDSS